VKVRRVEGSRKGWDMKRKGSGEWKRREDRRK